MATVRSVNEIIAALSLRQLEALCAVADEGSFRAGARTLGLSQSALSRQVALAERAFGLELFERPGGRAAVRLTPAGEVAVAQARRVLASLRALAVEVANATRSEAPAVTVGVVPTAAVELLPGVLRALGATNLAGAVRLVELQASSEVADQLGRGEWDLAFAVSPSADAEIAVVPLVEDPWVLLAPLGHELLARSAVNLEDLDGVQLVAWHRRWARQVALENACEQLGARPEVVCRTDDNLALQRLVAVGLGVACVGLLSARHLAVPELGWVPIRSGVASPTVALCYARHRPLSPLASALVAAAEEEARQVRVGVSRFGALWAGEGAGALPSVGA